MGKPIVSVIVPAYNEEKFIGACLDSLVSQVTDLPFEVIVVNNSSTDNTEKVVGKYKNKLFLKQLTEKIKGRGRARATGFDAAKGKYLLSLDADTIAPEDWIENVVSHLRKKGVVAVTGPWKVRDLPPLTQACVNNLQEIANFPYRLVMGHYWLTGLNFGIRAEVYRKCGGFDPTLNAHEDLDLTFKIKKLGKIKYATNTTVIASGRRYNEGLLSGLWQYEKTAISYFLFNDRSKILDDRR